MIKKIISTTLYNSKLRDIYVSPIIKNSNSLFRSNNIMMAFSQNKNGTPRNKQQAWMMQEQKNIKDAPEDDENAGKTYEGVTKLGGGAFLVLVSGLFYMSYAASKRSKQNLDSLQDDISGLKELKQRQSLVGGDWTLVNTQGQPFSSKSLNGNYYLIYFGYTNCPDICPSTLYYLSSVYRIIRNLPEGAYMKLKVVFVSVDPERDSPKIMKNYLSEFGKNIIGVTGTKGDDIQLKECLKKFKINAKKIFYQQGVKKGSYEIDHTTRVYLMDPDNFYLDHLNPSLTEQQTAKAIIAKIVQNEHIKQKAEQQLSS